MNKQFEVRLDRKSILITGGYGYLGQAIVEALLVHGATVYVLAREEDKFKTKFSSNSQLGNKLFFQQCDISDTNSIRKAFKKINLKEDSIDVLINNAFYSEGQSPENMTDEDWLRGIDGTLSSVFRCIREIISFFKDYKKGNIINVSSMYGVTAPDFRVYEDAPQFLNPPHYGAAKAGVLQLTRYYASYLGEYGITVNAVTPGAFPSNEVQKNEEFIKKLSNKTCLKRVGKPEELAGIFVFLSSEAASYITGQNFVVDGGWTIK